MHDHYYSGPLTVETAPVIVELMLRVLGDRPYTFTTLNEGFRPGSSIGLKTQIERLAPEKATSKQAIIAVTHTRASGPPWAQIIVNDTYGVWGFSEHPETFISIDGGSLDRGIYVRQRVGAGHLVHWKVAPLGNPAWMHAHIRSGLSQDNPDTSLQQEKRPMIDVKAIQVLLAEVNDRRGLSLLAKGDLFDRAIGMLQGIIAPTPADHAPTAIDVRPDPEKDWPPVSLSKLVGMQVADITGWLTTEFGDSTFELSEVVFVDGTRLSCEGEHDLPYLVSYGNENSPASYTDALLERIRKERDGDDDDSDDSDDSDAWEPIDLTVRP